MKVVDTTFLVCLLREDSSTLGKAEELDGEGGAATTVVNVYEACYGVYRAMSDPPRRMEALERLVANLEVLDLDYEAAVRAAEISGTLDKEGRGIDPFDSLIAGIALTSGAEALVTRNVTHFERVQGLKVEEH